MKRTAYLLLTLLFGALIFGGCESDDQILAPSVPPVSLNKAVELSLNEVYYDLYDGTQWGVYLPAEGYMPYLTGYAALGRKWVYQDLTFYTPGSLIGYVDAAIPPRRLGIDVSTSGIATFILPNPASYVYLSAYDDIYGYYNNGTLMKAYTVSGTLVGVSQTNVSGFSKVMVEAGTGEPITYFTLQLKKTWGWYQSWIHIGGLAVGYIPQEIPVSFDIIPAVINLKSKGVTPAAVYSTAEFDASMIDISTLTINGLPVLEVHGKGHIEDVNRDGLPDMMLHFNTQLMGLTAGNFEATLKGSTTENKKFTGSDIVLVK